MEMEGSEKTDLEFTAAGLNNSNQFSENQVDPNICKLAGVMIDEKEVDISRGAGAIEGMPALQESMEPQSIKRNGRYNLRKSLAWDSAFFTSAGVLDPDELSGMITSIDKTHSLPGIEEEMTGSTESISTLQSDTFTLESLEDDLFVDIRASIQRSSRKASNLTNSSSKTSVAEVENGFSSALKKEDMASQSKNPRLALKKTSGLQPVRMSKYQPKQNTGMPGSGKAAKQDSVQPQMKSTVFPKPPKVTSKAPISSASTKDDPMIVARAKSQSGSSKLGSVSSNGTQPRKVSTLYGAKTSLPKPTVLSKSSLVGSSSSSRMQSTRSSISSDSSCTISSEAPAKSPLMTARRNIVKISKVGTAPSGSTAKTPSRAAMKNKPPSSKLSAHLMSTKISPNVSPASSISEWSSASSSSSLMVNQSYNNSRTSLDVSSSRSVDSDAILSNPNSLHTDQNVVGHGHQGIAVLGNNSKKSSTRTATLQAPAKPSGLRMPSPKIGFFDGAKSSGRTPNGSPLSQSGLQSAFPKSGLQTKSSNIKLKNSKVPTVRTVTALTNVKPEIPKATSPASFQEKSHSSGNDTHISTDINSYPLPLELEGNATGEICPKTGKFQVEDGDKQVLGAGSGAMTNVKPDFPKATSPASFPEKSHSSANDTHISIDANSSPLALELEGNATGENCPKTGKFQVEDGDKQVVNEGSGAMFNNLTSIKPDSPKATSPASFQEKSHSSGNDTRISTDIDSYPLPLELEINATGENCPKTGKFQVEDGDKQVVAAGSGAMFNANLPNIKPYSPKAMSPAFFHAKSHSSGNDTQVENVDKQVVDAGPVAMFNVYLNDSDHKTDLSVHKDMVVEDMKIATFEENNASVSKYINQSGGEDVLVNQNLICEANGNENGPVNNQGQGFEEVGADINSKISGQITEIVREILDSALLFPAADSESSPHRAPFALKNSFCNDECITVTKESANLVAENTGPPLPPYEQKENI